MRFTPLEVPVTVIVAFVGGLKVGPPPPPPQPPIYARLKRRPASAGASKPRLRRVAAMANPVSNTIANARTGTRIRPAGQSGESGGCIHGVTNAPLVLLTVTAKA